MPRGGASSLRSGIFLFKLDFLYAGALPAVTRSEQRRRRCGWPGSLRAAAGENYAAWLRLPAGPAIGLVDPCAWADTAGAGASLRVTVFHSIEPDFLARNASLMPDTRLTAQRW